MNFTIPIITPLLITAYNGEWVHPAIDVLTLELDESEDGYFTGDLMRLDVEFKGGKTFRVIVLTNEEGMVDMMGEDEIQNYLEMLLVAIGEDVWMPDNHEAFVFTDYGRAFSEEYPLFTEQYRATISPDVSLTTDGSDWWWKS